MKAVNSLSALATMISKELFLTGVRALVCHGDQNHTLVLRNHGLITAGSDCTWVFVRHFSFIRSAEVQLLAMSTRKLQRIPPVIMARTREQFEVGFAQAGTKNRHPEWPALLRLIDQKDPTWKL